jgi:uncharacterized protein YbjT (DUF2867 family)
VISSGLEYTVVRPGHLTDDPPTGKIHVRTEPGGQDSVPRADVAATLLACLDEPGTAGKIFELFEGDEDIPAALQSL